MRNLSKTLAIGLGIGVVVVGLAVSTAAAQTPASGGQGGMYPAMMARLAATLGVSEAQANEAFAKAHAEALDEAVSRGYLTQAQADWMKQRHALMQAGGIGMMTGGMAQGMMGVGGMGQGMMGGGGMGQGMMGGGGTGQGMMGGGTGSRGMMGGAGFGPALASTPVPSR